jgi:hypothetical protein
MQSAFIINDRTGKPYAVVGLLAGGTEFYPIAESAVSWASWMTEDFAAKKITKQQLTVTLDNSMSVDGPMPANRANKPKLDELIKKAKKVPKGESDKEEMEQTEEKSLVPVISIMDARLDNLEDRDWRNTVNFKAKSFITDSNKSTFAYEVKRTRAVWDASLSIPGTNRRGGFRCPPGTRYGGQITDRFGRNCGWGVARRLANEIADLGERVENVDDRRRERRVNRRNERVARRLREGGRVERAARAVGDALESPAPGERKPGVLERVAGRVAEALDTPSTPQRPGRQRQGQNRRRPGVVERAARRVAEALDSDGTQESRPAPRRPRPQAPQARPARPRQPRRPREETNAPQRPQNNRVNPRNIVEARQEKIRRQIEELEQQKREAKRNRPDGVSNKDWNDYKAHVDSLQHQFGYGGADRLVSVDSYEDWARKNNRKVPDAAPKPQAPRRPRPAPDNTSKTPVPAGAPKANETLEQYKTRKYNEHQARVRKIREEGGNAGFLRREEWEQFHGPMVEENWNRAQQRNGGRASRRVATDANAGRSASRRPNQADEPDTVQPPRRQRRPFNAPGQRGMASEAAARRKREQMEMDNQGAVRYNLVKHDGKYYVVDREEVRRANAAGANLDVVNEGPRPPVRRPGAPGGPPAPPAAPPAPPRPATPRPDAPARPDGSSGALRPSAPRRNHSRLGRLVMRKDRRGEFGKAHVPSGNMTEGEAVEHIRNGGSLDAVPREHMLAAVEGNIWSQQNPTGKFVSVQKNGGAIGDTRLYAVVDAQGRKTGAGYVFKGANDEDNVGEIAGFNLANMHGFDIEGAVQDGKSRGRTFVVIPFNSNNIPDDWKLVEGVANGRNFNHEALDRLPDKAAPQRVAHFLHNYMLGVADRHGGNGMGFVYEKPDGTRVGHVVPIDQGWAAFINDLGFQQYYSNSNFMRMEPGFFGNIKGHIAGLSGPEKERQRQAIIQAVDDMIENTRAVAARTDAEWMEMVTSMYPDVVNAQPKATKIMREYRKKAKHLQDNRDEMLQLLGVDD